jgi:hypothetical protein
LPPFFDFPARNDLPIGKVLVSVVWVFSAMAILGGMAYGFEKAARKSNNQYV